MAELLQMLRNQGLATPYQLIVLVIDGYLVVIDTISVLTLLSAIIIASTFTLQAVRGRFLLLYPRHGWAIWETSEIDTYYLRSLIVIAIILAFGALVLGLSGVSEFFRLQFDASLTWLISYTILALILLGLVPLMFALYSNQLNDRIVRKLKKYGPWTGVRQCPFCGKGYSVETREVLDSRHGSLKLKCTSCNKEEDRFVSIDIGNISNAS